MLTFEKQFWSLGYSNVLGMDEAGRGPLAGPVCIAGVIFEEGQKIPEGINDSKKLSKATRERLFDEIIQAAKAYEVVFVSASRIDKVNILNAVKEGMRKISKTLNADAILSDAVNFNYPNIHQIALIQGDSRSISIAAASILAKVSRDRKMEELAKKYPQYGFEKHSAYGTKEHIQAIKKFGTCPEHRKTFKIK